MVRLAYRKTLALFLSGSCAGITITGNDGHVIPENRTISGNFPILEAQTLQNMLIMGRDCFDIWECGCTMVSFQSFFFFLNNQLMDTTLTVSDSKFE